MDIFRPEDPISKLEGELRSGRPTLDRSVQRSIARRVHPGTSPARRTALALVLTTSTLGAMSAMGGVGFAFGTVSHSFGSNSQSNSLKGGNSWGNYNGYGGSSSGSCYKNYPPKPPKKHCHNGGNQGGNGNYGNYGGKGGGYGFGW